MRVVWEGKGKWEGREGRVRRGGDGKVGVDTISLPCGCGGRRLASGCANVAPCSLLIKVIWKGEREGLGPPQH